MTYRAVITDRAARDLDEAYRWIAERAPEAAARW
jgi:plasmid stabilization system protein ParE